MSTSNDLVRLSISIEKDLYERLEQLVEKSGYVNRSEYIRDLVREHSIREEWDEDGEVLGTITVVYDHRRRELSRKLTDHQHRSHGIVLASTHIHLDEDICAEMIMLKGKASEIKDMAGHLGQEKGVFHAGLQMNSTGGGFLGNRREARRHSH